VRAATPSCVGEEFTCRDECLLEILSSGFEHPTKVRYGVLGFSVTMAVILYLDRMAISVALPAIAQDLHLDISQVADSVAVFFWCYALCQIPAGWLGDRWGGRRALTSYVVAWSLAMAGLGLAQGLVSLVAMRALLGIGQAGAYATTASFLRRWMPFERRGFANSAVSLGGRAGGVLAPALTSILMRSFGLWGMEAGRWRPVFIGYGCLGLVWAFLFWRWFRDRPQLHSGVNRAEIELINGSEPVEPDDADEAAVGLPARALVASRELQLLGVINFAVNVGWIFVGTLLPTYLIQVHSQSEVEAGFAASLAAGAGMAGCLTGGLATDFLVRRLGLTWGRRVPSLISYGGAAISYAICFGLDDVNAIVVWLIISSFLGDFALGALWSTYQDIGGAYAGTVLGAGNMCGNIGAAVAASLIVRLAAQFGWSSSFLLSAVAYFVGAAAWLFVDPHRRIGSPARADDRKDASGDGPDD
jgi:ACS family glucarate transporter-like MFS transporter